MSYVTPARKNDFHFLVYIFLPINNESTLFYIENRCPFKEVLGEGAFNNSTSIIWHSVAV